MKKSKIWIILLVLLILVLGAVYYYIRYVSYPRDKDGMVYKAPENVESLVVSSGGGYGSIAGTHRIELEFIGDQVSLKTHLDEYDGKKETDMIQSVEASPEALEELYALVQDSLWELQNNLKKDTEILDAGIIYISVNGETYGGYGVTNEAFFDVVNKAFDTVGKENVAEFRQKIAEWFGEEW